MAAQLSVLFAGGGTGGHVYPAIAIADALRDRAEIAFAGSAHRLEAQLVPEAGYPLHTVSSKPIARRVSFDLVRSAFANIFGIAQSLRMVDRIRPDLLIATGGYVCFPVVVATRLLRALGRVSTEIILVEPNARPGLTNRLLLPLVGEVWGSFDDVRFGKKFIKTGVPVRVSLTHRPRREAALASFGLDAKKRTLLVMGGSQGARSINEAVVALVRTHALPEDWQVLLVTGSGEYERLAATLRDEPALAIVPYVHDVGAAYAAADLVLARAGASTLAELAAIGLPALLVPYPHAAGDHQNVNARAFAATGAGVVLDDAALAGGALREVLADAVVPERLLALQMAARSLAGGDALAAVLARIDVIVRRNQAAR